MKNNSESEKSQSQCLFMVKGDECHQINLEAEYQPNISEHGIFDSPESPHKYENWFVTLSSCEQKTIKLWNSVKV